MNTGNKKARVVNFFYAFLRVVNMTLFPSSTKSVCERARTCGRALIGNQTVKISLSYVQ